MRKKVIRFCQAHWFSASLLAAMVLCPPLMAILWLIHGGTAGESGALVPFVDFLKLWPLLAVLYAYPLVLTGIEFDLLVRKPDGTRYAQEWIFDGLTLLLGSLYTPLYLWFYYPPINIRGLPAILMLSLLGLIGYLVLTYTPRAKLARPVPALCLAAMVLACGAGIAFAAQAISRPYNFWVALLPLNMVFITVRTMRALK